jgi:tetratricopeptide (TPR) repeat protein
MLLGHPEKTLPVLREAESIATELGDTQRLGRVVAFVANGLYLLGDHAEAIASAGRARDIAAKLADFSTRVTADIYAGRALHALGRFREAGERFRSVVDALRGARTDEYAGLPVLPSALARSYLVMALSELGEFESALAVGAEAVAIADATRHPDTIQWACYALGVATLDRGEAEAAIGTLERALTICRSAELPVYVPRAESALGHAYVLAGRPEGVPLVVAAAAESEAMSHRNIRARILARLGEVTVMTGQWQEGLDHSVRALALAREHGERASEAHALRVLATAYAAAERFDESRSSGEAALCLAEELTMQGLAARCHLDLGRLARSMGHIDAARRHLVTAHETFERLGMTRWQREAAERTLLG